MSGLSRPRTHTTNQVTPCAVAVLGALVEEAREESGREDPADLALLAEPLRIADVAQVRGSVSHRDGMEEHGLASGLASFKENLGCEGAQRW